MKISYIQNRQLHKLLTDSGQMVDKPNLVWNYTNGRTTHSSEMESTEAASLIKMLQMEYFNDPSQSNTPPARPGNKIRRSIMSMSYTMGIITKVMTNDEKVEAINCFIKEHPKTKDMKPFNDLNIKELQALHYQFEKFLVHKLNK